MLKGRNPQLWTSTDGDGCPNSPCPIPVGYFVGLVAPMVLSSRFLVFPSLGRSLQSALDDNPKHVLSEKCVLQVACRLVRTSEPLLIFKSQLPRQTD